MEETKEQLYQCAVHWRNAWEQTEIYNAKLFRCCVIEAMVIVILLFALFYKLWL